MPTTSRHVFPPARRAAAMALALLLLGGCKEPLYTQLTEQEANEVFAVLARAGIEADKAAIGEAAWGIEVAAADIPRAVDALNAVGLPKSRFANLGEMFKREGIVATPTEERVRFMHGVSQELSNTLSGIDGVVSARVHLVIPQNDPLAEKNKVASASVFIKHRMEIDLQPMLPAIKSLVLRSVEGLTFDTVFVSFFPAERPAGASTAVPIRAPLLGLWLPRNVAAWLNPLFGVVVLGSLALAGYTLARHRGALLQDVRRWLGRGDDEPEAPTAAAPSPPAVVARPGAAAVEQPLASTQREAA